MPSVPAILVCLLFAVQAAGPGPVPTVSCNWGNQTSEYDESCAKQAARYSSVAYDTDLNAIYEWQCVSCQHSQPLFILDILDGRKGDIYGFIGYQVGAPEILILSFRGTIWLDGDSAKADLLFREVPWPEHVPDSAVHGGFLEYYKKVEGRIRDIVAERLRQIPETKLVITGHSLGGAAAVIAAVDLFDIVQTAVIYTFGSPRVGNSFFAQHLQGLNLRMFRVNHDHDMIPHLPPCTYSFWNRACKGGTYPTHAPREVLYNYEMTKFKKCSSDDGEDIFCSDAFSAFSFSIKEHLYYFGYDLPSPPRSFSPKSENSIIILEEPYKILL